MADKLSTQLKHLPEIHGHRGARGLYPENSLIAIEAGISNGCNAIEVDLCVTRDNRLVIHHDPVLSRDLVRDKHKQWIRQEIKVFDLELVELNQFDIGKIKPNTDYAARFGSQTSVDGTKIPTLADFVGLVNQLESSVTYNLELKSTPYDLTTTPDVDTYIELVVREIERHGISKNVFLQSFDWRLVIAAKNVLPHLKTGFLTDQQIGSAPLSPVAGRPSLWTANNDLKDYDHQIPTMIKHLGGDVWSGNQLDLAKLDVAAAQQLGLEVYAWTANSTEDMQRMIDIGVDAITTDYPDRLLSLLNTQ